MDSGHGNSKVSLAEVKKTMGETGLIRGNQHPVLDAVNCVLLYTQRERVIRQLLTHTVNPY